MATIRLFCALIASLGCAVGANIVQNGSFETNTAETSLFNLSNAQLGVVLSHVTAFGTAGEIDLVQRHDFGIFPVDLDWKLGLHRQSGGLQPYDAFSITLAAPVLTGSTYRLTYYGAGMDGLGLGIVDVGLSATPGDFGIMVFSAALTGTASWTAFSDTILAPLDASYLTFRVANAGGFAFLDAISLEETTSLPEPSVFLMAGAGLTVLGAVRVRRRTRS